MQSQHNKVYLYDIQESKERNDKIYGRNIPSMYVQPQFDLRPISTKYSHFQLGDEIKKPNEKIDIYPDYDPKIVFNPGNRPPPFSYFAKNIDVETNLRNSYQLPELGFKINTQPIVVMPKTNELKEQQMNSTQPNIDKLNLAPLVFNNNTRMNIKGNDFRH